MKGFKEFLMQGNLVELAVAVIIGGAFGEVVKSFTAMLLDLIGKVGATPNFSGWNPGGILVGPFLTATLSFVLVAAVVYFFVVKPVTAVRAKLGGAKEEAALTSEDLLVEIRDLLAKRA